ncbi:AraC family transcriptional regulator [Paenibacillus sp. A3]|uniref:helix-turn-helix domain-containing protein n=1 Tax=Paenibacillus sp. A3 TaxID=1337054 RepID=UPI001ED9ACE0|nr:AraC family transcriptional regulator [Paenibacillus sp. A3]
MLLESRQSVTSISDNLGYDSIHYFSKQFAAYYGISPTAFRSRNSLPRDLG